MLTKEARDWAEGLLLTLEDGFTRKSCLGESGL